MKRSDEITPSYRRNDSVRGDIFPRPIAVKFLIGPILKLLIFQLVSQQKALPQNVWQRLATVDGEIYDVIEQE
jgi:hypothetical protein